MLLAHPHPRDFSDGSRPLHSFYFMGLWRKQTVQPQEAEQFDIRGIVNEFKSSVCAYAHRGEGMDIEVSHVKRKDIPLFVFPGGVRPPRSSRTAGRNGHAVSRNDVSADGQTGVRNNVSADGQVGTRNDVSADGQVGNPLVTEGWSDPPTQGPSAGYQLPENTSLLANLASRLSNNETQHILNGDSNLHTESVEHEHPVRFLGSTSAPVDNAVLDVIKPPNSIPSTSSNGGPTNGLGISFNSSHKESKGIHVNNLVTSSPTTTDGLDELVWPQAKSDKIHANTAHVSPLEGCSGTSLGQAVNLSSHGNNHVKRKAEEELEPLELAAPSVRAAAPSTSTVKRKPLRLRLSTVPQPKPAEGSS